MYELKQFLTNLTYETYLAKYIVNNGKNQF